MASGIPECLGNRFAREDIATMFYKSTLEIYRWYISPVTEMSLRSSVCSARASCFCFVSDFCFSFARPFSFSFVRAFSFSSAMAFSRTFSFSFARAFSFSDLSILLHVSNPFSMPTTKNPDVSLQLPL